MTAPTTMSGSPRDRVSLGIPIWRHMPPAEVFELLGAEAADLDLEISAR